MLQASGEPPSQRAQQVPLIQAVLSQLLRLKQGGEGAEDASEEQIAMTCHMLGQPSVTGSEAPCSLLPSQKVPWLMCDLSSLVPAFLL